MNKQEILMKKQGLLMNKLRILMKKLDVSMNKYYCSSLLTIKVKLVEAIYLALKKNNFIKLKTQIFSFKVILKTLSWKQIKTLLKINLNI